MTRLPIRLKDTKKGSKYFVRHDPEGKFNRTLDGILFDSYDEMCRYAELKLLLRAGKIQHLKLQTPFPVYVNNKLIGEYHCDFDYLENGERIIEDVKSKATGTDLYRWKKKLVLALYGIEIRETGIWTSKNPASVSCARTSSRGTYTKG